MTDPPDLYLCTVMFYPHRSNFCPVLNVFLILPPFIFPFFAPSRRPCLAPCSAFEHFCSPGSKLYDEIMYLLTDLLPLDLSAAPTPSLFPSHLLCFLPPCFSRIPVPAPPHTYLLVTLLAISFLAVFAIVSQLSSGSFLELYFRSSIFGTWCTDV